MRRSMLIAMATLCLFGCGTCGTCDQKQAGDDDSTRPTSSGLGKTSPKNADGGEITDADSTNAKNDKPDGLSIYDARPQVGMPIYRLPQRPPMPTGPIQSCGNYDGPLCQKNCEKGNCRQDCDGTPCVLECPGGYCVQQCGASTNDCRMTCKGGNCMQICQKQDGCIKDCAGGKCI